MSDESRLHTAAERFRGEWMVETEWGLVKLSLRPFRIGYKSLRGTPDEIIVMKVTLPLFGKWVSVEAPILLEMEREGGTPAAMDDLRKFSERTCSGEQESHLSLPLIVVGKERKNRAPEIITVRSKVNINEVPNMSIDR